MSWQSCSQQQGFYQQSIRSELIIYDGVEDCDRMQSLKYSKIEQNVNHVDEYLDIGHISAINEQKIIQLDDPSVCIDANHHQIEHYQSTLLRSNNQYQPNIPIPQVYASLKTKCIQEQKKADKESVRKQSANSIQSFQLEIIQSINTMELTERQRQFFKLVISIKHKVSRHKYLASPNFYWFQQARQNEIIDYIIKKDKDEREFNKEFDQLLAIKQQIVRKYYEIEKICMKHHSNIYYRCLNERQKSDIYLCNECIHQIKEQHHHAGHEIICIRHHQQISYKLQIANKANQMNQIQYSNMISSEYKAQQIYLCEKCLDPSKQESYQFLSHCHYDSIKQLCLNEQCILNDTFKHCPACNKHIHSQDHHLVKFNKAVLMEQFSITQQQDIANYQQLFLDIRQRLKLHPLQKIINQYSHSIWSIDRKIQSFAVYNNNELQKWVDQFMHSGSKEDAIVLLGVKQIKNKQIYQRKKYYFLQCIHEKMQIILQKHLVQISEVLKSLGNKLLTIFQFNENDIEQNLDNKYEKIVNFEDASVTKEQLKLFGINDANLHRIKGIQLEKQSQQNQDQIIQKIRKAARIHFFSNLSDRLNINGIDNQAKKRIYEFILSQKNLDEYSTISANEDQIIIIKQLTKQLFKIERNYISKLYECRPVLFILNKQLTNLRFVRIKYELNLKRECNYSVSTFLIMKIIHINAYMEQMTIQGVNVTDFQEFALYLKVVKHNKQRVFIDKLKKFKNSYYDSNCKNMVSDQTRTKSIYALQDKWRSQISWLKKFHPYNKIRLSINGSLQYHLQEMNQIITTKTFRILEHAYQHFEYISGIRITVYLTNYNSIENWSQCFKILVSSLRKIKDVKLNIIGDMRQILGLKSNIMIPFLKMLTCFTQIKELQYDGLQFSQSISMNDFKMMEQFTRKIFQKNPIQFLKNYAGQLLPIFPKVTTLTQIQMDGGNYKQGGLYYVQKSSLMSSVAEHCPNLKYISCKYLKEYEEVNTYKLVKLQTARLIGNSWVNSKFIAHLPCKLLKNLIIHRKYDTPIEQRCLEQMFARLQRIAYLQLGSIDFDGSILLRIPSIYLSQLHIKQNKLIRNSHIKEVDELWPSLRKMTIYQCELVDGTIFRDCKFNGLLQITIPARMLVYSKSTLSYLKKRGIKIYLR